MADNLNHEGFLPAPRSRVDRNASHELGPETWTLYWNHAPEADKQTYKSWNSDLDSLLIFATLFSAVVTAFVVDTYKALLPDAGNTSVALQRRLLLIQLPDDERQSFLDNEVVGPSRHSMVIVNSLWFASLILSLATTFFTIMAKQWVLYLNENLASAPKVRGRQRQFRQHNVERWKLPIILRCLPIFLHISLLLFFAGMAEFTMQLDNTLYAVTLSLVALTAIVYVGAHVLSFTFVSCPYKTSVTLVLLPFVASIVKEITTFFFVGWYALYYAGIVVKQARPLVRRGTPQRQKFYTFPSLWSYSMRYRTHCLHLADRTVPWLNLARWERVAILRDRANLDIRALAWIIRQSRWTEKTREIALELCQVGDVLEHRSLLISSGAIPLLAQEFKTACSEHALSKHPEIVEVSSQPNKDGAQSNCGCNEIIQRVPAILARLVTESLENDPDTAVSFAPSGIPYNRDADDYVKQLLKSTNVFKSYIYKKDENLVHFANLLRLQAAVLPPGPAYLPSDLQRSMELFLGRLNKDEISPLNDNEVITVVNTILFFGVSSIGRMPNSEKSNGDHRVRLLEALEAVMMHRPHMGFAVRRQICYGIWALSTDPNGKHDMKVALIPIFKTATSICGVLTKLLTERVDNWMALRAALHLFKGVSRKPIFAYDYAERQLFLQAFVDKIPEFSQRFRRLDNTALRDSLFPDVFELLLQVWYLAFFHRDDHQGKTRTFDAGMMCILERVAKYLQYGGNTREGATSVGGNKYRLRIATYGAACRIVTLHMTTATAVLYHTTQALGRLLSARTFTFSMDARRSLDQPERSNIALHRLPERRVDDFDFGDLTYAGVVSEFADTVQGLVHATSHNGLALPDDGILSPFMEILAYAKLDAARSSRTHDIDEVSFSELFNAKSHEMQGNLQVLVSRNVQGSTRALKAFTSIG